MKKIDQIIGHSLFGMSIEKINILEKDRIFCKHGIDHGLDVARMAYITVLEQGMPFSKEVVYAAALLHDIGRWQQYTEGIPHDAASEKLAGKILADTDFSDKDRMQILQVIRSHREREEAVKDSLAAILYDADKKSRICWLCKAYEECRWPEEKETNQLAIDRRC